MPTTETFTSSLNDLRFHYSNLRLSEGSGVALKISKIDRKRVNAVITYADGKTEQVRVDQPLVWERDVPTEAELEAERVAARFELIKRFVAQGKGSYASACARIAEKSATGAGSMTSFDLDRLLEATAKGTVAERVEHAVLLSEGLTDAQRVERATKICADVLHSFWGSQSTSNASNQLEWHSMAAWGDLARDIKEGW